MIRLPYHRIKSATVTPQNKSTKNNYDMNRNRVTCYELAYAQCLGHRARYDVLDAAAQQTIEANEHIDNTTNTHRHRSELPPQRRYVRVLRVPPTAIHRHNVKAIGGVKGVVIATTPQAEVCRCDVT